MLFVSKGEWFFKDVDRVLTAIYAVLLRNLDQLSLTPSLTAIDGQH